MDKYEDIPILSYKTSNQEYFNYFNKCVINSPPNMIQKFVDNLNVKYKDNIKADKDTFTIKNIKKEESMKEIKRMMEEFYKGIKKSNIIKKIKVNKNDMNIELREKIPVKSNKIIKVNFINKFDPLFLVPKIELYDRKLHKIIPETDLKIVLLRKRVKNHNFRFKKIQINIESRENEIKKIFQLKDYKTILLDKKKLRENEFKKKMMLLSMLLSSSSREPRSKIRNYIKSSVNYYKLENVLYYTVVNLLKKKHWKNRLNKNYIRFKFNDLFEIQSSENNESNEDLNGNLYDNQESLKDENQNEISSNLAMSTKKLRKNDDLISENLKIDSKNNQSKEIYNCNKNNDITIKSNPSMSTFRKNRIDLNENSNLNKIEHKKVKFDENLSNNFHSSQFSSNNSINKNKNKDHKKSQLNNSIIVKNFINTFSKDFSKLNLTDIKGNGNKLNSVFKKYYSINRSKSCKNLTINQNYILKRYKFEMIYVNAFNEHLSIKDKRNNRINSHHLDNKRNNFNLNNFNLFNDLRNNYESKYTKKKIFDDKILSKLKKIETKKVNEKTNGINKSIDDDVENSTIRIGDSKLPKIDKEKFENISKFNNLKENDVIESSKSNLFERRIKKNNENLFANPVKIDNLGDDIILNKVDYSKLYNENELYKTLSKLNVGTKNHEKLYSIQNFKKINEGKTKGYDLNKKKKSVYLFDDEIKTKRNFSISDIKKIKKMKINDSLKNEHKATKDKFNIGNKNEYGLMQGTNDEILYFTNNINELILKDENPIFDEFKQLKILEMHSKIGFFKDKEAKQEKLKELSLKLHDLNKLIKDRSYQLYNINTKINSLNNISNNQYKTQLAFDLENRINSKVDEKNEINLNNNKNENSNEKNRLKREAKRFSHIYNENKYKKYDFKLISKSVIQSKYQNESKNLIKINDKNLNNDREFENQYKIKEFKTNKIIKFTKTFEVNDKLKKKTIEMNNLIESNKLKDFNSSVNCFASKIDRFFDKDKYSKRLINSLKY